MNEKAETLVKLREVFDGWEALLARLGEEQVTTPSLDDGWSTKDVLVHLWGWQQITLARFEAAVEDRAPAFPAWSALFDPDSEEDVDKANAWLYETHRHKPWGSVYHDWQAQFLSLFEVAERVPEEDMVPVGRFEWMGEWPLLAALQGTCEHHVEHLDDLAARLG